MLRAVLDCIPNHFKSKGAAILHPSHAAQPATNHVCASQKRNEALYLRSNSFGLTDLTERALSVCE